MFGSLFGSALVYAWRGDNAAPAQSVDEVHSWLRASESYYPGATARLSTLDWFVGNASADGAAAKLPTVERDLSDSWIWGAASDPIKLGRVRAWQRLVV